MKGKEYDSRSNHKMYKKFMKPLTQKSGKIIYYQK